MKTNNHLKSHLRLLLLPATTFLVASPVIADINFDLKYQDRGEAPAWDPDGSSLTAIMKAAAAHWVSFFPGVSHDVNVRYRWENPYSGGVGLVAYSEHERLAATKRPYGATAPNTFTIRFYTCDMDDTETSLEDIDWYVDADLSDHAEFAMQPQVVGSTSAASFINGSPSDFLEVGYSGTDRFGEITGTDLYSVALHELGHALGMGFRGKRDANSDGDYDVSSGLPLGGIGLMARIDDDGKVDPGHLAISSTLMGSALSPSTRRLPTAADILTIATINGWSSVRFPRTYTGSGSTGSGSGISWNDPSLWHVNTPDTPIGAMIMQLGNPNVYLTRTSRTRELFLDLEGGLTVNSRHLFVGHSATLMPSSAIDITTGSLSAQNVFHDGDHIAVEGSGSLDISDALYVGSRSRVILTGYTSAPAELNASSALVQLEGGALDVYGVQASVNTLYALGPDSTITGGAATFSMLHAIRNDGLITAQNGDLRFSFGSWPDLVFDLDGDTQAVDTDGDGHPDAFAEPGSVDARWGSVYFGAGPSDDFNGSIWVGTNQTVSFAGNFTLGTDGTARLQSERAVLAAAAIRIDDGRIEVGDTHDDYAYLSGPQIWTNGGHVYLGDSAMLKVAGDSEYQGGVISTGPGLLIQNGDIHAVAGTYTTLDSDYFDWNGDSLLGNDIVIAAGATLKIRSTVPTSYIGTITIEAGGVLIVDQEWTLDGELHNDGSVEGGFVTNHGTITGTGTIEHLR